MPKRLVIVMGLALMMNMAGAKQANINLTHNPQKDTEGLETFSASLNSPQVSDDQTVIFRIKAPEALAVML